MFVMVAYFEHLDAVQKIQEAQAVWVAAVVVNILLNPVTPNTVGVDEWKDIGVLVVVSHILEEESSPWFF